MICSLKRGECSSHHLLRRRQRGGVVLHMPLKMLVYVRVLKAFQFQLLSMLKNWDTHFLSLTLSPLLVFPTTLRSTDIPEGMYDTYHCCGYLTETVMISDKKQHVLMSIVHVTRQLIV